MLYAYIMHPMIIAVMYILLLLLSLLFSYYDRQRPRVYTNRNPVETYSPRPAPTRRISYDARAFEDDPQFAFIQINTYTYTHSHCRPRIIPTLLFGNRVCKSRYRKKKMKPPQTWCVSYIIVYSFGRRDCSVITHGALNSNGSAW
uniref:Uncharacterized protein n=1 Tax=Sipha flava TaxID=143950 RepID=A0A2S2R178_9HEMI